MPVGATIGAIGSLGAAGLGYLGSTKAAAAQTALGQQALGVQQGMFDQSKAALNPYITAGQGALPTLSSLLTPGPSQTSTLQNLPGFQFQSQWGNLAATNALAARGLGGSSGPLAKAISDYNQGLAGTSFGTLAGMLQSYASMGSGAAGALAGNATTTGANLGNTLTGIGSAQASGILGANNALATGLTGATNSASNLFTLNALLKSVNPNSNVNPATGGIYGDIQIPGFNPISGVAGGGGGGAVT